MPTAGHVHKRLSPGIPPINMQSADIIRPPTVEETPNRRGARDGKRSVTHLSKAQLARKRANDREAQRNIRQKTKEHMESLEKKVRELEGSIQRVLQRNIELEAEIDGLRSHISQQEEPIYPSSLGTYDESECPQYIDGTAIPTWDGPNALAQSAELACPAATWTPFHSSFSQSSHFASLQPFGLSEVNTPSTYTTTNCW